MVVHAIFQAVGQALHVGDFRLQIVRVLISLAVAQRLHQPSRRVAQMQRHRLLRGALHVLLHRAVSHVHRVRLGSGAQIDDRLRQRQVAFRHAEEVEGIARGQRDG